MRVGLLEQALLRPWPWGWEQGPRRWTQGLWGIGYDADSRAWGMTGIGRHIIGTAACLHCTVMKKERS